MKKVLSFALILALVLGSFSFAFGLSDIAASKNSEAIEVCSDLGIIDGYPDGTFKPEQPVTRAEFAKLITRALAIPESALAAYSATSFVDTSGYGWAVPFLAFCESKGIMEGYGNHIVMPGKTINLNEAIAMAARAIGYTKNSARLVGAWPSNYVTLGQTLGLYDDLGSATLINRESAAQLIYNSLTVPMVSVNLDGKTEEILKGTDKVTMLTAGLGATVAEKVIVKGNETTNVNLIKYVGAYADLYNKDNKVVAVGKVHSEFLTGKIIRTGVFEANDVEYTFGSPVTDKAINIKNGVYDSAVTATGIRAVMANSTSSTITIAVDLSGKTIDTVYSLAVWNQMKLMQATSTTVKVVNEDKVLNGVDFTVVDKNIDLKSFTLKGVATLQDIAADNVVQVWYATVGAKNTITRVEVGTKVVKGQVTKVATSSAGDKEYTIDGVVYNSFDEAEVNPAITETGTAYLTYAGDLGVWDVEDGATGNYAVVTIKGAKVSASLNATTQVGLFYKDGTDSIYTFDGNKGNIFVGSSDNVLDSLVKISLDKTGKITKITPVMTTNAGVSKLTAKGTFAGKLLADTVLVMIDSGDQDYAIGNLSDVVKDKDIKVRYGTNANGKIDVMVVSAENAGAVDTYGFVVSTAAGINAAGEAVTLVTAIVNEKEVTYTAKDDSAYAFKKSQLVKFKMVGSELDSFTPMVAVNATPGTAYTGSNAGNFKYATSGQFNYVTAYAISTGRVKASLTTEGAATWELVDDSATVLYAQFDGAKFDKFVGSDLTSINSGYRVFLIQLDADKDVYDLVVYVKESDVVNIGLLNWLVN